MIQFLPYNSPFGMLLIGLEDSAVVSLKLAAEFLPETLPCPAAQDVTDQLSEYFSGTRTEFDIPLAPRGTPFQKLVWQELCRIPYGQTRTYGEIAAAIGRPGAARAVGMACNRNPIWLLIPCHRVVGKRGALTGYAGGLEMKQNLLELEQTYGGNQYAESIGSLY